MMYTADSMQLLDFQRLIAVIEQSVERLHVLQSLTTEFRHEALSELLGEEISRVIVEQKQLEKKYEDLIEQRAQLKGVSNKAKSQQNERDIARTAQQLRHCSKQLCRNLQDNPNLEDNLSKIQDERGTLLSLLLRTLQEMKMCRFDALASRVEKVRNWEENLRLTVSRERELSKEVAELKLAVAREKREFETEVTTKSEQITRLKEDLQELKTKTAIETKYIEKEKAAKQETLTMTRKSETSVFTDVTDQLSRDMSLENWAMKSTEAFLKRKMTRLANAMESWGDRHEIEVAAKQSELENMKNTRDANLVKLQELEDRYRLDRERRERMAAEARRRAELEEIERAENARRSNAAVKVQCVYRVHMAKVTLDLMKNPKKKGKKGGGGKKGKKK